MEVEVVDRPVRETPSASIRHERALQSAMPGTMEVATKCAPKGLHMYVKFAWATTALGTILLPKAAGRDVSD